MQHNKASDYHSKDEGEIDLPEYNGDPKHSFNVMNEFDGDFGEFDSQDEHHHNNSR
jgi:hypothetical protein